MCIVFFKEYIYICLINLGYEIHTKRSVDHILADPKLLVTYDDDESITVLKPFSDPLEKFGHHSLIANDKFTQDIHNLICCEPSLDLETIFRDCMPDKMLLR